MAFTNDKKMKKIIISYDSTTTAMDNKEEDFIPCDYEDNFFDEEYKDDGEHEDVYVGPPLGHNSMSLIRELKYYIKTNQIDLMITALSKLSVDQLNTFLVEHKDMFHNELDEFEEDVLYPDDLDEEYDDYKDQE